MKVYVFTGLLIVLIAILKIYLSIDGKTTKNSDSISGLTQDELASISLKPLLTPTELKFSELLEEAIPELRVMYQVAVYQTIKISNSSNSLKIWNKLNRLTFDFVLIDRESNVLAVIELDDKSHNRAASIKRDQKKDELIKFLGKPLLRFQASDMPSIDDLRSLILSGSGSVN